MRHGGRNAKRDTLQGEEERGRTRTRSPTKASKRTDSKKAESQKELARQTTRISYRNNFKEWTADDVNNWLGTIGLGFSTLVFPELGIVGDVFPQLTDPINADEIEALTEIGLKIRSAVAPRSW